MVWFSLSLFHFTGTWLSVQDQKNSQNSKLFTCLFCFVAFSSRTIAPSCLTHRVPVSLQAVFTSSEVSWISFFRFFLCHSFKIQPSLSSHIIKIPCCTLKPSIPVPDKPISLPWCNGFQNDAECLKSLLQKAFSSSLLLSVPSIYINLYVSILLSHKEVRPCISVSTGLHGLFPISTSSLSRTWRPLKVYPGDTKTHLIFKKRLHAFSCQTYCVWEVFSLNISSGYIWLLKFC